MTIFIVRLINVPLLVGVPVNIAGVLHSFPRTRKRQLISGIIISTCEGLADVFVILYVTNVLHLSAAQYCVLVAVQMTTSRLVYLPAGKLADRVRRKPFVIATFLCFALFPLSLVLASGFASLVVAFVIGGLREIGELMIVDFAEPQLRARTVGLYSLVRSLTITPAAAIGGLLWNSAPEIPFVTASVIGLAGVLVFAVTVEERDAG